jgi:hypothetical protein
MPPARSVTNRRTVTKGGIGGSSGTANGAEVRVPTRKETYQRVLRQKVVAVT